MAAPIQTLPETPTFLASRPAQREMRVRFASRDALLQGLARARQEPWVEACRIDAPSGELVVRMAGGSIH